MNFINAIKTCFVRYADFKGHAERPEFWWFALFTIVASSILGFFSDPLAMAFLLITLLPSFAVGARRLHDTGRSGWWQLLWAIPVLGWLALIYYFAQAGTQK